MLKLDLSLFKGHVLAIHVKNWSKLKTHCSDDQLSKACLRVAQARRCFHSVHLDKERGVAYFVIGKRDHSMTGLVSVVSSEMTQAIIDVCAFPPKMSTRVITHAFYVKATPQDTAQALDNKIARRITTMPDEYDDSFETEEYEHDDHADYYDDDDDDDDDYDDEDDDDYDDVDDDEDYE